MNEKWPWIEGSHGMRSQLLDILSTADFLREGNYLPQGDEQTIASANSGIYWVMNGCKDGGGGKHRPLYAVAW